MRWLDLVFHGVRFYDTHPFSCNIWLLGWWEQCTTSAQRLHGSFSREWWTHKAFAPGSIIDTIQLWWQGRWSMDWGRSQPTKVNLLHCIACTYLKRRSKWCIGNKFGLGSITCLIGGACLRIATSCYRRRIGFSTSTRWRLVSITSRFDIFEHHLVVWYRAIHCYQLPLFVPQQSSPYAGKLDRVDWSCGWFYRAVVFLLFQTSKENHHFSSLQQERWLMYVWYSCLSVLAWRNWWCLLML